MEKIGINEARELVAACNKANHFKCAECKYHSTCDVSRRYYEGLEEKRKLKIIKRKEI